MKGPYILLLKWNCLPGDDICICTNRCLISSITWNINRAQRLWVCVCVFHVLPTQHWEHGALKRGAMGAISLPLRCQGGNFHHLGQIRRGFLEPRNWHQVTNNKCNIQAELKPMKSQWAPYPSIGKKQRRKHSVDGEASWANWLSWECAQGAVEGVLSWMASWGTGPLYTTR
jgi:hypothetical protein